MKYKKKANERKERKKNPPKKKKLRGWKWKEEEEGGKSERKLQLLYLPTYPIHYFLGYLSGKLLSNAITSASSRGASPTHPRRLFLSLAASAAAAPREPTPPFYPQFPTLSLQLLHPMPCVCNCFSRLCT